MDDLGHAMAGAEGRQMLMLGGGNPAHIPAVQAHFRERMEQMLARGDEFERAVGNYDPPQGKPQFIEALASLLRAEYGWPVGPGHYLFPGLEEAWRHKQECIRVTYSQDEAVVEAGLRLIAEEVKRAYLSQ